MLETPIDVRASHDTFTTKTGYTQHHATFPIWKTVDDMARYRRIVEATRPGTIVETGTKWGGFATWLADELGVAVITVDINAVPALRAHPRVTQVVGSSIDPDTIKRVQDLVNGRRVMVSLDADHHAAHVEAEIRAYGPMVSPGCYLVVEDGLADLVDAAKARRFGNRIPEEGGPLAAIGRTLATDDAWRRDLDIEGMTRVSHSPAGWWVRRG